MASGYSVRPNRYYDSVFLMGVNQRLSRIEGVRQTAVLMASEQNKRLLAEIGIDGVEIRAAGANDLVVAVVADSPAIVETALAALDEALNTVLAGTPTSDLHTLVDGLRAKPEANLALLTIPGGYVYREAREALDAGLNLFIFSSNVPVEDEQRLKQLARERNLLVMGPDCGTSIVNGVGLGFANAVRRGTIGAIGPSGTGLQEFTCQVHHAGFGISHAVGTGSHDLSDDIGGITTLMALDRLEADPQTEVIAIVAKPAGPKTRARLVDRLQASPKPTVACLLGSAPPEPGGHLAWAGTIDAAASAAIRLSHKADRPGPAEDSRWDPPRPGPIRAAWTPDEQYLRGLFAGGTLCYQSQQMLRQAGLTGHSNVPLDSKDLLGPFEASREHTLIDMGDDVFTLGRLHPMIDGSLRRQRILTESADPTAAILLLDFVLGYNASPDPVNDVLEAIAEGQRTRSKAAGPLTVVASVCGTEADPQGLSRQMEILRRAGAVVFRSNAGAMSFCLELLKPN
jgi:succinyl-CoA synthetase alpha subunit